MHRFLSSALCVMLAPLLVAQQTAQSEAARTVPAHIGIDLTGDAGVRLLTPQPEAMASIQTGDLVQFTVATDVTSGDVALLHAGVPVAGVVAQVKHSSRFHHRDGQIFINVTEMVSGKMTEIVVRCSNPADPYVQPDSPHSSTRILRDIAGVALVGLVILVIIGATQHTDG